jgi:thioredoxin 1
VAQQDLARFYGVMTVPSTVVLKPNLQPVAVNHGLATPEQLARQIAALGV